MKKQTELPKKVECAVRIAGNYAAFHEIVYSVMYDYTNKKLVNGDNLEEIEADVADEDCDYGETQKVEMLLYKGKYYLPI